MTAASLGKNERLQSIQALRGIAAFLVLIFHCAAVQRQGLAADRQAEFDLLSGFWDRGYAGVDLFFVISGFVMVYVSGNYGRKDVGRFLYNRVTRIYPIWWVFAILMALYFLITYGQASPPDRVSAEGSTAYLIKSLLLIPQESTPVLGVGWTLIHEVYFYIIFALSLFLPRKILPVFLFIWAALTSIGFALGGARPTAEGVLSLASSLLTLEFIAGALLACFMLRTEPKYGRFIFVVGVLSFVSALIFYTEKGTALTLWGRVMVYTLPCLALLYGLVSMERAGHIKISAFYSALGDWSYTLYLSHMLVILTIKRVYQFADPYLPTALQFQTEGMFDNLVFSIVTIFACIVFSAIAYHLLERPLLRGSRVLLRRT